MKTHTRQLEELYEKVRASIISNVKIKGTKSELCNELTIKIDSRHYYNLDGSYIMEVADDYLIDDEGNFYTYCVLPYDELVALADWIRVI